MRLAVIAAFMCLLTLNVSAQENNNLELIANVPVPTDANDIWGYVDEDGIEYAIMGTLRATRIYSLEDPTNPAEIAVVPGARSIWRDIKSYKDHLYVTTDDFSANEGEIGDGLIIIDMSMAPDSITYTQWQPDIDIDGITGTLGECHNLYIDTTDGHCYLAGCQEIGSEGVIILDLTQDPKLPVVVGIENNRYAHDVFVLNDQMYTSDILAGFLTVYDISDKSNAVEIGRRSTTSFFTHNAWGSDDGNFIFTTDERPGGRVDAYDLSDPDDIVRLDDFRPVDRFANNAIPHNTHYYNGYLVTSWYTEGLVVMDAHRPDNLVKIASYDTYLDEATIPGGSWFFGLWGAYPYLPSGLMLGSDINTGLYVWKPVQETNGSMADGFVRASYLEGVVTDANNGEPISGVAVRIMSDDANDASTTGMGEYKTGQITEGTFMVEFTHPNYNDLIVEATLEAGEVTILDVELGSTPLTINTFMESTGEPLPWTRLAVENVSTGFKVNLLTRNDAQIVTSIKGGESYRVLAGKWGYKGKVSDTFVAGEPLTIDISLADGYQDDFFADLGWTVETSAETGAWQRGIPQDQSFGPNPTHLSQDIPNDIGDFCFATGLNAADAGANDIDNGATTLISRHMDFSGFDAAKISYHLFFANAGGQGSAPDDDVTVKLTNGLNAIDLIGLEESNFAWSDSLINIVTPSDIEFTDSMVLTVTAVDRGEGHISEAQFDAFSAELMLNTASEDLLTAEQFAVLPNPVKDVLQIQRPDGQRGTITYEVYSQDGRLVERKTSREQLLFVNTQNWAGSGIYSLQLTDDQGRKQIEKIVKL